MHNSDGAAASVTSASEGVEDPGVHVFDLHDVSPVFNATQTVAFCIGIADLHHLPADDPEMKPFLHLPLTEAARDEESPTRTFLLAVKDHEDDKSNETSMENP